MKKNPFICVSLAFVLSTQSFAFAATDRTQGIGDQEIAVAQQRLASLKTQLISLDRSLQATAISVQQQRATGRTLNLATGSADVAAAFLGLMAFVVAKDKASDTFVAAAGVGAAIASVTGIIAHLDRQERVSNVQATQSKVTQAQGQVSSLLAQSQNPENTRKLNSLLDSLNSTQSALMDFDGRDDNNSAFLKGQVAKLASIAMVAFAVGMTSTLKQSQMGVDTSLLVDASGLLGTVGVIGSSFYNIFVTLNSKNGNLEALQADLEEAHQKVSAAISSLP